MLKRILNLFALGLFNYAVYIFSLYLLFGEFWDIRLFDLVLTIVLVVGISSIYGYCFIWSEDEIKKLKAEIKQLKSEADKNKDQHNS